MKQIINRDLGAATLAGATLALALGCAAGSDSSETNAGVAKRPADVAQVQQALTSECRLSTVGLPCDPDGDGAATECEGVCWVDDAALVSCRPVAELNKTVTDLNGRICGDVEGRNCGKSCENGQCVDKNARLGTACRPANNSSTCDGVCTLIDGQPTCDEVAVCAGVRISDDGCSLRACNFDNFETSCKVYELENTVCEASKIPVIEAGTSTEADASVSPDAGDAASDAAVDASGLDAAAVSTNDTDESSDTSSDESSDTRDTESSSSESSSSDDAGSSAADAGPTVSRATKVVGGACSVVTNDARGGAWLGLVAAIALGALRRRRS